MKFFNFGKFKTNLLYNFEPKASFFNFSTNGPINSINFEKKGSFEDDIAFCKTRE